MAGTNSRVPVSTPWDAPALTALELSAGMPLGVIAEGPTAVRPLHSPAAALEAVLADALQRIPCLVSFSGGRDSSALLAVAQRVAPSKD